jgi:plasmid stability protein
MRKQPPHVRTGVLYIRGLSRDLKDQFKAHCARRGKSMTEKIEELIRQTLKEDANAVRGHSSAV